MSDTNHELSPAQFASLLRATTLDTRLSLGQVLSVEWITEVVAREVGKKVLGRIYTPLVTLAVLLGQVFSDDHSCRLAVARLLAWRASRGLPDSSPDTGAFCKARQRIPDSLLPRLTCEAGERVEARAAKDWLFHDRRVVIADGTTATMPDTAENQEAFPQHSNQKRGCGFPIARMVVLLSLATGCVLEAAIGASKGKLTGEHALLRKMHKRLRPGDILLGDAYYSSFDEVALLLNDGVDVVMRQAGNRHTDFRAGTKLGRDDHLVEWQRHRNRPAWMDLLSFRRLPRTLLMRELRVRVDRPGFRTRQFVAVTSLLGAESYPREELAGLYRARWHAELDIRSIKQTMKMDVLRCKAPEMVRKEIWAHLLVYNMIRAVMAEAARRHGLAPRQISLQGARQTLEAFRCPFGPSGRKAAARRGETILRAIAYHEVGDRPDRVEPRVVKRRPKAFPRMQIPRKLARRRLMRAG